MICTLCYCVLRGHQGAQWRGTTFDLHFDHHVDRHGLEKSAGMSCYICRSILREILRIEKSKEQITHRSNDQEIERVGQEESKQVILGENIWSRNPFAIASVLIWIILSRLCRRQDVSLDGPSPPEQQKVFERQEIDADLETSNGRPIVEKQMPLVTAHLYEVYDKQYRLDFKLRGYGNVGMFILQKTSDNDTSRLYTPVSHTTSSDEVLQLAKRWIRTCRSDAHPECPGESSERKWYPTRLIDVGEVDPDTGEWPGEVRLVLTRQRRLIDFYVTLSHCWGNAKFRQLSVDNMDEFHQGIKVDSLPKTFQHAINFTRRLGSVPTFLRRDDPSISLPTVRYIWIDSLCIIQGKSERARADWLAESATMLQIYNSSYCNISATAAANSDEGLFVSREPHTLWEDEINLNVEGLPMSSGQDLQSFIQRCVIQDLSFWARTVDEAPVNRRGWVLQERLLAPRVLHFCESQVAWECSHLEAAESARDGIPSIHPTAHNQPGEDSAEIFDPGSPGQRRHSSHYDSDFTPSTTEDDALEHWQTVIERYSKTQLTNTEDKLIALSGFAQLKSVQLPGTYLAGMWEYHLASQLLWYVDPVFANGHFEYPSTLPKTYRAPSWSWAAVDAPQGITCNDITDRGILIAVENPGVALVTDNKFGFVKGGQLRLKGILKEIELKKIEKNGTVRYGWNLLSSIHGASKYMHTYVYLDSPSSIDENVGGDERFYCVPARKTSDGYIVCLLLQLERRGAEMDAESNTETGNYRRTGITKVSPYEKGQSEICELSGDEPNIPHGYWNAHEKKHSVYLV